MWVYFLQAAIQAVFYDVAVSSKFDLCIVSVIFLNMIAMAVDHYKMTDYVSNILDILNILFTTVFTLESVVKIIGLRHHYFRQPWNVFDFVVVVLSLLGKYRHWDTYKQNMAANTCTWTTLHFSGVLKIRYFPFFSPV